MSLRSTHLISRGFCALTVVWLTICPTKLYAQASVSSVSIRPFVTAIIPVIGRNGVVGGVSVDAEGVLARAVIDREGDLLKIRRAVVGGEAKTSLRMVSLAGLEKAFAEHLKRKTPIPDEILFLAGLQRVEYVFALPDRTDIVIAGPAERWRIDPRGAAVGVTTGRPTLRLDDLLEALRTAEIAAEGRGISCSIDPTEEGLARLEQLLRARGLQFSEQTTDRMRAAVGRQEITVTGVLPDSHFARVMVAADYQMKRLAMDLEEAPIAGMPSYMDLLKSRGGRAAKTASPRWWLAVNYAPLLKSEDGLSWQLRGPGVKVMTEDGFLDSAGKLVKSKRKDPQAQRWADTMTAKYDELSVAMPVFGQLRDCMDLAVVAALITNEDMPARLGVDFPLLMDGKSIRGPKFHVPTNVESHLSIARARSGWIVGVSGGVDLDSWSVLREVEIDDSVAASLPKRDAPTDRWWWD
jgi:hypothetical protein